jgi:hypothetical protein
MEKSLGYEVPKNTKPTGGIEKGIDFQIEN